MRPNLNKPKKKVISSPQIKKTLRAAGVTATGVLALMGALRIAPIVGEVREHKRMKSTVLQEAGLMNKAGKMSAEHESLIKTYERKFAWGTMNAQQKTNTVKRLAEMADGVSMLKRGLQDQGISLGTKDLVNSLRSNHKSVDRATIKFNEHFIWGNTKHGNNAQNRLATMAKNFNNLPLSTRKALMGTIIEKPIYAGELSKLK